jgi:hypothetical protein
MVHYSRCTSWSPTFLSQSILVPPITSFWCNYRMSLSSDDKLLTGNPLASECCPGFQQTMSQWENVSRIYRSWEMCVVCGLCTVQKCEKLQPLPICWCVSNTCSNMRSPLRRHILQWVLFWNFEHVWTSVWMKSEIWDCDDLTIVSGWQLSRCFDILEIKIIRPNVFKLIFYTYTSLGGSVGWGIALKPEGCWFDSLILHWHNPYGCTVALVSNQPLTEMSTGNISRGGGGKGGRFIGLTALPPSFADCLEI